MQENIEIWKDVVGYERYYQVSNFGSVRSLDRIILKRNQFCEYEKLEKGIILKQNKLKAGYIQVTLMKNGIPAYKKVHRLVCECFIENINNYPMINHKDEIKTNNNVDNLEWCDAKYNRNYGTMKEKMKIQRNDERKSKKVAQIKNGELINIFPSVSEVQRLYGYKRTNICRCCNGMPNYNTAYGYVWKYL